MRAAFSVFLLTIFSASTSSNAQSHFNMKESFSEDVTPFPKWTGMTTRFSSQGKLPLKKCGTLPFFPCEVKEWKRYLRDLNELPLSQQIKHINAYGNSHPYITDEINWAKVDFWETPHEFFSVSGDCEDYAITKYYSLRSLGVPAEKMRIIIVQDFNLGGIIHAILGVYADDELMILDNQIKQVIPASRIYHYKPIYGINEQGWWVYYPSQNS